MRFLAEIGRQAVSWTPLLMACLHIMFSNGERERRAKAGKEIACKNSRSDAAPFAAATLNSHLGVKIRSITRRSAARLSTCADSEPAPVGPKNSVFFKIPLSIGNSIEGGFCFLGGLLPRSAQKPQVVKNPVGGKSRAWGILNFEGKRHLQERKPAGLRNCALPSKNRPLSCPGGRKLFSDAPECEPAVRVRNALTWPFEIAGVGKTERYDRNGSGELRSGISLRTVSLEVDRFPEIDGGRPRQAIARTPERPKTLSVVPASRLLTMRGLEISRGCPQRGAFSDARARGFSIVSQTRISPRSEMRRSIEQPARADRPFLI